MLNTICNSSHIPHLAAPPTTLRTLSSTSIKVQWTPPPNSYRLPLTYHVNYTEMSNSTKSTTLTLTGLQPYEEYTISVQAGNRAGLSVPVNGTARTYSDSECMICAKCVRALFAQAGNVMHYNTKFSQTEPFSRPSSRAKVEVSSRWCLISWRIPEECGRHGIIAQYIIELNNTDGGVRNITHELNQFNFSSPANVTHNLTNLTPNTKYRWRVAAATVNGTGPFTPSAVEFQTCPDGKFLHCSISFNFLVVCT